MALSDRQLLDALSRMPFIDTAELARILGEAHATIHRALTGLLAEGIVGRVSHTTSRPSHAPNVVLIVGTDPTTPRIRSRVRLLPDSTSNRIRGDLDVRAPRRSARARASVRRWPWSSRRGRSVQVKLIKMGGRLVRHSRRLIFQLSEVSVPQRLFQGVLDRIGRLSPAPS